MVAQIGSIAKKYGNESFRDIHRIFVKNEYKVPCCTFEALLFLVGKKSGTIYETSKIFNYEIKTINGVDFNKVKEILRDMNSNKIATNKNFEKARNYCKKIGVTHQDIALTLIIEMVENYKNNERK